MSIPTYVTPAQLMSLLISASPPTVIDVREDDRVGGHITNSIHLPAPNLIMSPAKFIPKLCQYETLVFHCMFSQVRGPTCAAKFSNAVEEAKRNGQIDRLPRILILEGGFQRFLAEVKSTPDNSFARFIEAYDPNAS